VPWCLACSLRDHRRATSGWANRLHRSGVTQTARPRFCKAPTMPQRKRLIQKKRSTYCRRFPIGGHRRGILCLFFSGNHARQSSLTVMPRAEGWRSRSLTMGLPGNRTGSITNSISERTIYCRCEFRRIEVRTTGKNGLRPQAVAPDVERTAILACDCAERIRLAI